MKAAVLHEFKAPLKIEDVPRPQIAADEVLIAVDACGVCHSDLHVAEGDWKQFAGIVKRPLILGHEVAGRVTEAGASVQELKIGDRVGVPWLFWSCGECEFCREGNENLCVKQSITGVTVDGGFAEFLKVRASHATRIPDSLSALEAAPLFCAGVTVHRALKHASISPGQRLAIFGVGGLGHLAIQLGRALGAEITAIDVSESKLEMARSLGSVKTLNAATGDVTKEFRRSGGAHVALVTSGSRPAYDTAFAALRPTGLLLVVGLPAEDICFPPIMMAAREVRIQA
ncbi:MAG TPA: alcohol dehydrogenase catalytic domain-containing protein, partial [Candidatus Acidoferrales bacterium]|nr:alcohol dehydrogenase catalytic domain-containing protein [Candidatus Acidoferrales bacterium]